MKQSTPLLMMFLMLTSILGVAQEAQPYVTSIAPSGALRGTTAVIVIEGFNLTGSVDLIWTKPGIASRVVLNTEQMRDRPRLAEGQTGALIVDKATRNRLTIEITVDPTVSPGLYGFRVKTALGTTNLGRIYIGSLPEALEREPNDTVAAAQSVSLPATLVGEMSRRGDADYFRFAARAGQEIVFEVIAAPVGSRLDSVLTLLDQRGTRLASNNDFDGRRDSLLGYKFTQDGEFLLRIEDFEKDGRTGQFGYRLNIGDFPYLLGAFPPGVRAGTNSEITLSGYNLGQDPVSVRVPERPVAGTVPFVTSTDRGPSLNAIRLGVGTYTEVIEAAGGSSRTRPQSVPVPVTINGRLESSGRNGGPPADFYRFTARKGQRLVFEVEAQRLGSPLDSLIEIFDTQGEVVPRAKLRCLLETSITLNDPDSGRRGIRILNWGGLSPNDYVLIGDEILQVESLPKTPDDDLVFKGIAGSRTGVLDTTPETHAVNTPVYKVSIHPPHEALTPNGLPVRTVWFRNDDGPPSIGKDSRLSFLAPADGDYIVGIRDTRGQSGERFVYRLSLHEPRPNFLLAADPENPNVPRGGRLPITVTATRLDEFDGEIDITTRDLPSGFRIEPGVIRRGESSTVIVLSADPSASGGFRLRITGDATINGHKQTREVDFAERVSVVSLSPPPELAVSASPAEVVLVPGSQAYITVSIRRERGFAGRVPIEVRNLPPGIVVKDVGLNGVLITETETTQRFLIEALRWVEPTDRNIFVIGRIETTSPQRSEFAAAPLRLRIQSQPGGISGTNQR